LLRNSIIRVILSLENGQRMPYGGFKFKGDGVRQVNHPREAD
jgi:hypothetical protein